MFVSLQMIMMCRSGQFIAKSLVQLKIKLTFIFFVFITRKFHKSDAVTLFKVEVNRKLKC